MKNERKEEESLTAPALFRTLHEQGGTVLLDEAERLRDSSPETGELLSMFLAGYKRGGRATRLEAVGDTYRSVEFDVFGPKALACVKGLPPALSSRCIPVMMFRAAPDSPKPRRRIDAEPERWRALRDDLHMLALEHGQAWLDLVQRSDVCPAMTGRDYELWQPLLALAAWFDFQGAQNLLKLMQNHALATIESHADDKIPETDEVLLWTLRDLLQDSQQPSPTEVLDRARATEPDLFGKNWQPSSVGRVLKRYGIRSHKSDDRREYRSENLAKLCEVQRSYQIDLNLPTEITPTPTPDCCPVPSRLSRPAPGRDSKGQQGTVKTPSHPETLSTTS